MDKVRIKYLLGTLKKTEDFSERKSLFFYLKLKTINSQGLFKRGEFTKLIHKEIRVSIGSIKPSLLRLVKKGWARELKDSKGVYAYQLVSYDKVFSSFGYKFRKKRKKTDKFKSKGCKNGKILFVSLSREELKDIHVYINEADIRQRSFLQNNYIKGRRRTDSPNPDYSSDVSCKELAKMNGCKSRQVGLKIMKRIKQGGRVKVNRNKSAFIKRGVSKSEAFLKKGQYWLRGSILEYRANTLSFSSYPMYALSVTNLSPTPPTEGANLA